MYSIADELDIKRFEKLIGNRFKAVIYISKLARHRRELVHCVITESQAITWVISGIKPEVLAGFQQQLSEDFQRTVERFLALQTMGTETARQDARALKKTVLALPMPDVEVLNGGLEILKTVDLRESLCAVEMPFLRMYGYLDGLVPRKVVPMLDALWPQSESLVFAKAAHAPFISHPAEFCSALVALKQRL